MRKYLLIFFAVIVSYQAFSQNHKDSTETNVRTNAIQISPIGLFTGNYHMNYEHLFKGKHGFVIGLSYINSELNKGNSISLSYRNHYKPSMKSFFWGVFANYTQNEGFAQETINGSVTNSYGFSFSSYAVGPNIGKRWMSNSGLSLVLRIGYGFSNSKFIWDNEKPKDAKFSELAEDAYKIFAGLDGEISVGYCF